MIIIVMTKNLKLLGCDGQGVRHARRLNRFVELDDAVQECETVACAYDFY